MCFYTYAVHFFIHIFVALFFSKVVNKRGISFSELLSHYVFFLEKVVKKRGINFSEFACLARCNGAEVRTFRQDHSSEAQ